MNRRYFLAGVAGVPVARALAMAAAPGVRVLDIVHHTHLDVGYTAMPAVVRENQIRYLDAAIACCREDARFRWTIETLLEFDDWWRAASPERRATLQNLVRAGRMDVMAMPFNQTPFMNAMQWEQAMKWIPATLWRQMGIQVAMQNDVNGFPRAGAKALLDRGIPRLMMGINADSGGPPFRRPDAFWWKQPDGRRLFVWLGEHYGSVMNYLVPARDGVRYRTDEASVRKAHAALTERLTALAAEGYGFERLILTHTHPMLYDNGHPYPSLVLFIAEWNRLGLAPALRLTTATDAMLRMEKSVAAKIPTYEGEWTDWWANGDASGPREVAASRVAKRTLAAAFSPVFGPMPERAQPAVSAMLRDLCLFDEHTWGAAGSLSEPHSLLTIGQYVEKSHLAYRPMGRAEALLGRRLRAKTDSLTGDVHVVNPSAEEMSGWATVPVADAKAMSLTPVPGGVPAAIAREGNRARCWFDKLPARSVTSFRLSKEGVPATAGGGPDVKLDPAKWPLSATWPGMARPLFAGGLGDFVCVGTMPWAHRGTLSSMHVKFDAEIRKKALRESNAAYGAAQREETAHSIRFTQEIKHPRLGPSQRVVELWKGEPRARVKVSLDRLSSLNPEVLFLSFDLPEGLPLPVFFERRHDIHAVSGSASRELQGLLRH